MKVIIVGGGKTGAQLARQLLDENHHIRLIEIRTEVVERLKQALPEQTVISGDGSSPNILEAAGIKQAQVLAAVTGEDEANLVITTLARFEFGIPRTIARVNNPKNTWLFTPEMGVDVGLNQTDILARLIAEEMSMGDMMTLLKLRRGEYSLVEEKLPVGSKILGVQLRDVSFPQTCVIAAVIRRGKVVIPRGDMVFEAGDEVLAVVANPAKAVLRDLFAPA
ncbi:MAG: potassium transporter TrkA [Chloroflexi bacterium RBG_16_57_11]|nr:MAG: potassium transporter TrkA [Chloroflexi bacterium RBG_16_57_11]